MDLAEELFRVFETRLSERLPSIAAFVKSHKSFEEWLNWEFYDAAQAKYAGCTAKPPYSPRVESGDFGDLAVKHGDQEVFCEVALVHDDTGEKWASKIEGDGAKLNRLLDLKDGPSTLQCIVVASRTPGPWEDPVWKRYSTAIGWDQKEYLEARPLSLRNGLTAGVEMRAWMNYRTRITRVPA